jgi:hypothetical protein
MQQEGVPIAQRIGKKSAFPSRSLGMSKMENRKQGNRRTENRKTEEQKTGK